MKILVVGSGGREHALVWKLRQSPRVKEIFCAPGNAGMANLAVCVNIAAADINGLLDFAKQEQIDLTVVGPEIPLTNGIVDLFEKEGLKIFGPSRAAAEIEGSKAMAKDLMAKYHIPTARYATFDNAAEARAYVQKYGAPCVIKADGLAAGKGVIVAEDLETALAAVDMIMAERAFGRAGDKVVIEEYLQGEEVSVLAFVDGETVVPMVAAQDHKRAGDQDTGPNTGGMGAYAPAPVYTPELADKVLKDILYPTVRAMAAEGRHYRGVLYAGLMVTPEGPKVLEFNARFGDPETQPVLALLKTDLVDIIEAVLEGRLARQPIVWQEGAAVCVVMAAGGYPGKYETGQAIKGLERVPDGVQVFHAGTARRDGKIVTNGGRVLGVTALGRDIPEAIRRAYQGVAAIEFAGAHYRTDIGQKAVNR
ncbi:phosphoribosylamine--glycine ligase [Desulforamulus hydrothermalis]|uniref:Phosphoribosylamine--glycine ligase n=1 Tax=Desulforamulus hydrothermalis Lam5 = DSM 18033 TaxID=1121428 RepID=K8E0T0_9FIRM|nr:phosphoribosylamine--glycine ligase [Desulforamulus hydrothermalis]CCO09232.1 Phosphoribosylamine--glycine ligase [Desulforamulus hydrothermalis Lam5 = DSM 18033]SHH05995.1 phosphoribosylamine--glycine ligase [Desulforamulus hydrothermalis Lam5 = DSM 18033]